MSAKIEPPAPKREPVPPLTLRQQLEAGPVFVPWLPMPATQEANICATCGGPGPIDVETNTCRPCWRCWRWSAVREREPPKF